VSIALVLSSIFTLLLFWLISTSSSICFLTLSDLRKYLSHIQACTNMSCLTPDASLAGECGFLSANMYARSLFGEDALANLSIELVEDAEGKGPGSIQGHVRIRSKTQGIALSLGDKITLHQKIQEESN